MGKQKTHEEFCKEVFDLVEDEYIILSKYINANIHIDIKHNKCNYEYKVKPAMFLSGRRCPKCGNRLKYTTETFGTKVKSISNNEYEVLGEYINNKTKIKIKHLICKHEWDVRPNDFLKGNRCPQCAGNIKKTTEQFKEEVYQLVNNEYFVLGEYINNHTDILMKHNICNSEYMILPSSFLSDTRCPTCNKIRQISRNKLGTKMHDQYCNEIYDLYGDKYTILNEYINCKINIKVQHNECNNIFYTNPQYLLKTNVCPNCSGLIKKTTEYFKEEVKLLTNNEYCVLGEYVNSSTNILIKHNICGNEFLVTPNSFLSGKSGCHICNNKSKGENKIKYILDINNILFKPQYSFKDCKNITQLRFDFGLLNSNYNLVGLIEYQGIQHYEPIEYWGGQKHLEYVQCNDNIKYEYCIKNNIPLLRIPYWEFDNIEIILDNFLKEVINEVA